MADPKIVFHTDQLSAAFMEAAQGELEISLHEMNLCSAALTFPAELYEMLTLAMYAGSTATLQVLTENHLLKVAGA